MQPMLRERKQAPIKEGVCVCACGELVIYVSGFVGYCVGVRVCGSLEGSLEGDIGCRV